MGGLELVSYIRSIKGKKIDDKLSKTICEKIQFAKPYAKKEKSIEFKEGVTKYGKKYVRVKGILENAREICENYKAKGYKTTEIKSDKRDKDVFYFYIEQQLR